MAEKKDDVEVVDEASGGKSKKMIIIIAVVALALIGGGAALFLGGGDEASEEEVVDATPVKQAPIYHSVEKPLIINFKEQSNKAVSYLRFNIEVMARDQATIDAFKLHLPAIKHDVLLLLLGQKYDTLKLPDAGDKLQEETLTIVNNILTSHESGNVEAVYTDLFMK